MNYYLTEDGYLMHYGIEGQKWGKRNGPPYPLDASQASASEKRMGFRESRFAKKEAIRNLDPEKAKNKQTKRVAMDYYNLSDNKFRAKYKTSKEKFAKRYYKTDGDTYSMGLKKAAAATAIRTAIGGTTTYNDPRTGKTVTVKNDKATALKDLAKDIGYSEVAARLGYKNAEAKYKGNNDKAEKTRTKVSLGTAAVASVIAAYGAYKLGEGLERRRDSKADFEFGRKMSRAMFKEGVTLEQVDRIIDDLEKWSSNK